jgi:UDP-2,3-diacylglucosamine hydrolase
MARQITLKELHPLNLGDLGRRKATCISDIHYLEQENESDATFLNFLEKLDTDYLFLLGDMFDFWLGNKHDCIPAYRKFISVLMACRKRGIRIVALRGNRDFLAQDFFKDRIGAVTARDAVVLTSGDKRVLLTHGDTVCTWDIRYAAWRRICCSDIFSGVTKILPFSFGRLVAKLARAGSRLEGRFKPLCSIELFHHALGAVYREGIDVVAAGHIHNPGERTSKLNGAEKKLFILGRWRNQGRYLEIRDGRFDLKTWHEEGPQP